MKINIDAGHGSNTAGKRTPPLPKALIIDGTLYQRGYQFREHYANVGVAYYLEKELKRCGFEINKTGWNDADPTNDIDTPLTDRQNAIAKAKCDYSISIHYNAHGDGSKFTIAEGTEILIHNQFIGESEKLAQSVLKHLIQGSKQVNRGVKKQSLAMCNCNAMNVKGAILVELAFMTNEREATELMANEIYWKESAVEICKGLCEYVGVKYIPEKYTPSKTITANSSKKDINWLKSNLNTLLDGHSFIPLELDGVYDNRVEIALRILWEIWGWNKDGESTGKACGVKTINKICELIN